MINLHWLELPMTRKISHGPKGVRVIEVRLYIHVGTPFYPSTLPMHIACSLHTEDNLNEMSSL